MKQSDRIPDVKDLRRSNLQSGKSVALELPRHDRRNAQDAINRQRPVTWIPNQIYSTTDDGKPFLGSCFDT